jgi:hypothetical protein
MDEDGCHSGFQLSQKPLWVRVSNILIACATINAVAKL